MINNHQPKTRLRYIVYPLILILGATAIFWSRGKTHAIIEDARLAALDTNKYIGKQLTDKLINSQVSSISLMQSGITEVKKKNLDLGQIFLIAASEKDNNLRDAALYAGFTALAFAENYWNTDPSVAKENTEDAVKFLERAKLADPIHSYTYELLAVAYDNLGNSKLAEDARNKAASLASNGEDSSGI